MSDGRWVMVYFSCLLLYDCVYNVLAQRCGARCLRSYYKFAINYQTESYYKFLLKPIYKLKTHLSIYSQAAVTTPLRCIKHTK